MKTKTKAWIGLGVYLLIAIALLAVAVIAWRIAGVGALAFGGVVLAAVFRSLADPLARRTGLSGRWSLAIVILLLVVFLVLGGWLFGNLAATQINALGQRLPAAAEKLSASLQKSQAGRAVVDSIKRAFVDSKMVSNVGVAAGAVGEAIADLLLVIFLGIYFAADPVLYREGALRLIPPARRPAVRQALDNAGEALRRWLLGQGIAMVSVGLLAGISLALVGVPLALALGVVAGLFEFIPVVGPILSAVPGVLLGFAISPETAVYALIAYTAVQQIESNVIIPVVQRWAVELAPVTGLLAVVAFGLMFGVLGIIFATPVAVVLTALVKNLYVEDTLENGGTRKRTAASRP